jgi:hypothetical protein
MDQDLDFSGHHRLSGSRRLRELPPAAILSGRETADLLGLSFKNFAAR